MSTYIHYKTTWHEFIVQFKDGSSRTFYEFVNNRWIYRGEYNDLVQQTNINNILDQIVLKDMEDIKVKWFYKFL